MAATACSSDSDSADALADGMELRFQASTDTRAAVVTNSTIKNTPFAVYGEYTPSDNSSATPSVIFNGTEVKHNGSAWQYENVQYWFPGMTYSFVAVHPYSVSTATPPVGISHVDYSGNSNTLSFTYTLPSDYTKTTDLLAATHRRRYSLDTENPAKPVAFSFGHLLSRLNFTAKIDPSADSDVTIHRFTLRNVGVKGTFSIKPATIISGTETNDYVGGDWTVEDPSTDENNPDVLFTITDAGNDCLPKEDLTISPGLSRPLFRAYDVAAANAADHRAHPANPLFILPQEVNSKAEVEIEYSVGNSEHITATANLYSITVSAHNGVWEKGKSYSYTFSLGADEFIIFSQPTVEEWNPDEGGNYVIIDKSAA